MREQYQEYYKSKSVDKDSKPTQIYGMSKYMKPIVHEESQQFIKDTDSGKYIRVAPNKNPKVLNIDGSEK